MEKLVEVKNLVLAYNQKENPELSNISLEIWPNEIVSLVGPSGCGKSTLIRLIAGVLKPTSGEIKVFGENAIPGWSKLSFVPQDSLLLPWRNVWYNLALPLELKKRSSARDVKDKVKQVIKLTGLCGSEEKFPSQLSGGMKQRAALARALVTDAELLLLDEPFASLDALTRSQLHMELLRIKNEIGVSILLVTHNIFEAVFLSNRVMVMGEKPGQILGEIKIDLEYPRDLKMIGTPIFSRLVGEVQQLLEEGWRGNCHV